MCRLVIAKVKADELSPLIMQQVINISRHSSQRSYTEKKDHLYKEPNDGEKVRASGLLPEDLQAGGCRVISPQPESTTTTASKSYVWLKGSVTLLYAQGRGSETDVAIETLCTNANLTTSVDQE